MKRIGLLTVALILVTGACDDGAKSTSAPAAAEASGNSNAFEDLTDEQLAVTDLPVEADFEEVATTAIQAENLDAQVAALEKEILGDS